MKKGDIIENEDGKFEIIEITEEIKNGTKIKKIKKKRIE